MRKTFVLAVLGSAFASGGAGAIVALRTPVDLLPQVLYSTLKQQPIATETASATGEVLLENKTIDLGTANRAESQDANLISQTKEAARFERIIQYAVEQKLPDREMGDIIQAIAQQFLGAPYKANLLDGSQEETLTISLDKFDCVLFVETVLAIARGVAVKDYAYQTFSDRIVNERYRDGQLNGYCSRLHYFVEWIFDNQKRGNVADIASQLGGVSLHKKLNFMSKHRELTPPIATNDANYQCLVETENKLDELSINYIPLNQIRRVYTQLQPGDVVAVATSIAGLDVTHTGLVYRNQNGTIGIIHASPSGTVRISRDLQVYVGNIKNAIGIMVARPSDPRPLLRRG